MNKIRRKEIYIVCNKLETFKNIQASERRSNLTDIINDIEMILSDEQYYMDSIPENMQGGSKYEKAEEACDNLENAISELNEITSESDLQDISSHIDEAIDYLYEAMV